MFAGASSSASRISYFPWRSSTRRDVSSRWNWKSVQTPANPRWRPQPRYRQFIEVTRLGGRSMKLVDIYIKFFSFYLNDLLLSIFLFFFNSSNENFSYKIVKWKVCRVTLKLEMLIAGIVIIIYFFCKVFDSFRFFKWQIRKSTSEEKRNVKKVAELLSIPMDETLRNSSMEPIRISSSPVNQMRNEKDEIAKLHSLSPRNKNRGQSILQNQSKRCVEDQMNQVREHGNFSLR